RSLARQLGALGHELFLLGIDPEEMERSAADLQVRTGKPVGTALCDMENCDTFAPALDLADAALGGLHTVIITAALFATQEQLEANIDLTRRLVNVNYATTVVLYEHVRRRLLARGGGRLVVFSSVA